MIKQYWPKTISIICLVLVLVIIYEATLLIYPPSKEVINNYLFEMHFLKWLWKEYGLFTPILLTLCGLVFYSTFFLLLDRVGVIGPLSSEKEEFLYDNFRLVKGLGPLVGIIAGLVGVIYGLAEMTAVHGRSGGELFMLLTKEFLSAFKMIAMANVTVAVALVLHHLFLKVWRSSNE